VTGTSTVTTASKTTSTCQTVTECNARDSHTTATSTATDECDASETPAPDPNSGRIYDKRAPKICGTPAFIYPRDPSDAAGIARIRNQLENFRTNVGINYVEVSAPSAGMTTLFWIEALTTSRETRLRSAVNVNVSTLLLCHFLLPVLGTKRIRHRRACRSQTC